MGIEFSKFSNKGGSDFSHKNGGAGKIGGVAGFNIYYKIALRNHICVPKFSHTWHTWANTKLYFSRNFHWNSSSLSEDMNFYLFNLTISVNFFWTFVTITRYKKLMTSASIGYNNCIKNCINMGLVLSLIWRVVVVILAQSE